MEQQFGLAVLCSCITSDPYNRLKSLHSSAVKSCGKVKTSHDSSLEFKCKIILLIHFLFYLMIATKGKSTYRTGAFL